MESNKLSKESHKIIRAVLAGHESRKREYIETLEDLKDPLKATKYDKTKVMSSTELTQPEQVLDRIMEYEKTSFTAKAVNAVEQAKASLMLKYGDGTWTDKVFKAICLNAENRYRYPFHVLDNTMELAIHLSTFMRIKDEIIEIIADFLEIK